MAREKYAFGDYSPEQVDAKIAEELADNNTGAMKFASTAGTAFIRKNVFEEGWARNICPFIQLNPESSKELIRLPNTDYPVAMFDIEPATYPAVTLPFDQSPETLGYYGTKALMRFFKISTPEIQKNIITLATYPYNIRKVMMDGLIKNMQKQEDFVWASLSEQCTAKTGANYAFSGSLDRGVIKEISKIFVRHGLNHGSNLLNKSTYIEIINQDILTTGNDMQGKMFEMGVNALDGKSVGGMKWLATLKSDIIPDNVIFSYTELDYLGKCAELYRPVMYVKKEKDRISCCAQEVIGMLIANEMGVAKTIINSGDMVVTNTYPQIKPVTQVSAGSN